MSEDNHRPDAESSRNTPPPDPGKKPDSKLINLLSWRPANRTSRILLLLVLIWIVGLADLGLTLLAPQNPDTEFVEGNPIAAAMLHSPDKLIVFKIIALTLASAIFIVLRRHRLTEIACWAMCIVHFALALLWRVYFYQW